MSRSTTTTRRCAAAMALAAGACGELQHTNPYDPGTKVDIHITGPDSATSLIEELTFTFTSDPRWIGDAEWRAEDPKVLQRSGPGQFRVVSFPPLTATVYVRLGTHEAKRVVVLIQRAARIEMLCGGAAACGLRVGERQDWNARMLDRGGFLVTGPSIFTDRVRVESTRPDLLRITAVGSSSAIQGVSVQGVAPGTAYLRFSNDHFRDSAAVTIQ